MAGHRASGRAPCCFVAPLGLAALILFGVTDIPLRVRFAQARSSFEHAIEHPEDADGRRYGTYSITQVRYDGRNVIFYDSAGAFLDDAGFAYLPDGPGTVHSDGSFEGPQFEHLTGDWYTWTASW